jgi:phosphate transport system protein
MEPHIRSQFDKDLQAAQGHLVRMGAMVEAALLGASEALDTLDLDRAQEILDADRAIDELEELINDECAQLIALRAPIASDLRMVLAVMRTANSLERVGDYAKNVAKRIPVLAKTRRIDGATGTIRRMSKQVATMLDQALTAFVTRDAALAVKVRESDIDVDEIYATQFRALVTHMLEDPANISAAMHLHFIAKNIERAGDHATTVAEQAIYLATGSFPKDDRPKMDTTNVRP